MDIQMPEMDGYTAVSLFRQHDSKTPNIALTTQEIAEDRAVGIFRGFTDYTTKPIICAAEFRHHVIDDHQPRAVRLKLGKRIGAAITPRADCPHPSS